MSTFKRTAGTLTSLTVTGFSTLASATYVASNAYTASTNNPSDVMVEVTVATTNSPAGNKQVKVFVIGSYDASNFQTGPTSGTTTTEEVVLTFIGVVPVPLTATTERKAFSVAMGYGGIVPPTFKVVLLNDLGVALTTGTVATSEIVDTVV